MTKDSYLITYTVGRSEQRVWQCYASSKFEAKGKFWRLKPDATFVKIELDPTRKPLDDSEVGE